MADEVVSTRLLGDLQALIDGARERAASAVNRELVLLYWEVGHRIHVDLLEAERGGYGEQIVLTVSQQLVPAYGRGFSRTSLHRMVKLASLYPDREKVLTLLARLSWSHFLVLLPMEPGDPCPPRRGAAVNAARRTQISPSPVGPRGLSSSRMIPSRPASTRLGGRRCQSAGRLSKRSRTTSDRQGHRVQVDRHPRAARAPGRRAVKFKLGEADAWSGVAAGSLGAEPLGWDLRS